MMEHSLSRPSSAVTQPFDRLSSVLVIFGGLPGVGNDPGGDSPAALDGADDDGLVVAVASGTGLAQLPVTVGQVHVAALPAHEGLVHFHYSLQTISPRAHHRPAQLVQARPGRLVAAPTHDALES